MRNLLILAIATGVIQHSGLARAEGLIHTLSSFTCDDWNRAEAQKDTNPGALKFEANMKGFVAGYLSARAVLSGNDFLNGIEMITVTEEINSQCKLRKSAPIVEVALRIAHKLEEH